jgi:hypothetical protein
LSSKKATYVKIKARKGISEKEIPMPDEIAQSSETEGLETVEGVSGDEVGLAPDFYTDGDAETSSPAAPDDELPPVESEEQPAVEQAEKPAPAEKPASEESDAIYTYGNQKFTSFDEISNYIKSVEGRQRNTQANERDAVAKNDQWISWGKDPAALRARLAELEGTTPEKITVSGEKKTFVTHTDWPRLKQLVDSGRGMEALAIMQDNNDKVLQATVAQLREEMSGKIQPMTDAAEARAATVSIMSRARDATDAEGNLVWPEFNQNSELFDQQFCDIAVQVWKDLPAALAWDDSLHGMEIAYNRTKQFLTNYRAANPEPASKEPAPATTEAAPAQTTERLRDAQGKFIKQTENQATAIGGSGSTPPPSKGPAESFSEAAVLRDMDRADSDRDPVTGIRR